MSMMSASVNRGSKNSKSYEGLQEVEQALECLCSPILTKTGSTQERTKKERRVTLFLGISTDLIKS